MYEAIESRAAEAVRACLFAVIERFNTEDPFWGSFVPESKSTLIGEDRFSVCFRGRGVRLEVQGVMLPDGAPPGSVVPRLVVGASTQTAAQSPCFWHPVTCTVDAQGRFVTSNFRKAIENAIEDLRHRRVVAGHAQLAHG